MHQYVIYYKRGMGKDFAPLNGTDHASLIDHQEIRDAVEHMRINPWVEGMCLRLDDELFNIMSFTQEARAPHSFVFDEE